MKNIFIKGCILLAVLILAGCGKDEPIPIGEPSSKLEGINDEFVLDRVMFIDNLTPFDDNTLDVSETFIGDEPLTISFNANELTYSVVPGTSLNFFGETGNWNFDNNDFPSYIHFEQGNSEDMLRATLLRTIRSQDEQLQIILGGKCDESAVSYELYFNRKSN